MYIKRHIENVLKKAETQTKVILLTGPRQVGKSTAIRKIFPRYTYITLDNEDDLNLALNDRALFFKDRRFPIIIDEVQYANELLRSIKKVVDERDEKGIIFLTGSQTYELLALSSETLSGRITTLELSGLSAREVNKVNFSDPFIPSDEYVQIRADRITPYKNLWKNIHRGSMPELLDANRDREWFYRDYVRTYIERDIRRIVNVKDEMKFRNFLISLAARSSNLLVYEDIASDVGVDIKTAQHWTSVVAASGIIKIIHPYYNNAIKRAIKTPKIYFMDTGLLCYFVGWKTPESAENGAMSGAIFETYVVSEIIKSFINAGRDIENLYFYRDRDGREIDLLIDEDNTLYPVEIKKGATIDPKWAKGFSALHKITDHTLYRPCIICRCDEVRSVKEDVIAVPVEWI